MDCTVPSRLSLVAVISGDHHTFHQEKVVKFTNHPSGCLLLPKKGIIQRHAPFVVQMKVWLRCVSNLLFFFLKDEALDTTTATGLRTVHAAPLASKRDLFMPQTLTTIGDDGRSQIFEGFLPAPS